jgi:hypothetical protein
VCNSRRVRLKGGWRDGGWKGFLSLDDVVMLFFFFFAALHAFHPCIGILSGRSLVRRRRDRIILSPISSTSRLDKHRSLNQHPKKSATEKYCSREALISSTSRFLPTSYLCLLEVETAAGFLPFLNCTSVPFGKGWTEKSFASMASIKVEDGSPENIQKHHNEVKYPELKPLLEQNESIIPEQTLRRISLGPMKQFVLESDEYS